MIVEAQYNWRGFLTGYRQENSFIPSDPGNSHFQSIQLALNQGACVVVEPTLGSIHNARDRYGKLSGYFTRFGFVPVDQDSHLLGLIKEQIADGRCIVLEPLVKPVEPDFDLERLVLCTILEQPWPHLKGPFKGAMAYASHEHSAERTYHFTIRNLPNAGSDRTQWLLAEHEIQIDSSISWSSLQFGVLEIDLPIRGLKQLFMGERKLAPSWLAPTLADCLEQHYAQTRRKPAEGPDIAWLIDQIGLYSGHFVVDFSNHIIDAFKREYGFQDRPMQCLTEGNAGSNPIVIGYSKTGSARLLRMVSIPSQNHGLIGEWSNESLKRYRDETKSPGFLHKTALMRVSEMVKLGFHPEALAPLNAYLEVAIQWALASCVMNNRDYVAAILNLGHKRRLEILSLIAKSSHDAFLFDDKFRGQITSAEAIYKNRNSYVHAMQLPGVSGRMTLSARRNMEALFHGFLDHFEQNQFLMRLQHIAEGTDIVRQIIVGALQEVT
jgi:hypothetical protein